MNLYYLNQVAHFARRTLFARKHLDLFSLWVQAYDLEPRKRKLQSAQKAELGDLGVGGVHDHGGRLGSGDFSHDIWLPGIHDLKFQLLQVPPEPAGDAIGKERMA
jgi:hypothetical protein